MMPYSKINIGDVYANMSYPTKVSYAVIDKSEGLILLETVGVPEYLNTQFWTKPSNRLFTLRNRV